MVAWHGHNAAGGDFAGGTIPGVYGTDYAYPVIEELDYWIDRGLNHARVNFSMQHVMTGAFGSAFQTAELNRIKTVVNHCLKRGVTVNLDPHDYAAAKPYDAGTSTYGASVKVGTTGYPASALADFLARFSAEFIYAGDRVSIGLNNEPNGLSRSGWFATAQLCINAMRTAGFEGPITVPGTNWTGLHSWMQDENSVPNTSNAYYWAQLTDPLTGDYSKLIAEMHQYFDSNYSGTSATMISASAALAVIDNATAWANSVGCRIYIGEMGVGPNSGGVAVLDAVMPYIHANDCFIGYAYWGSITRHGTGYVNYIGPNLFKADKPTQKPFLSYSPSELELLGQQPLIADDLTAVMQYLVDYGEYSFIELCCHVDEGEPTEDVWTFTSKVASLDMAASGTTPPAPFERWNPASSGNSIIPAGTGWTVTNPDHWEGGTGNATLTGTTDFPTAVVNNYSFLDTTKGNGTGQIKIAGLDPANRYTIQIASGKNAVTNTDVTVSVVGLTTVGSTLAASGALAIGSYVVQPSALGEIFVNFSHPVAPPTQKFSYLNALRILEEELTPGAPGAGTFDVEATYTKGTDPTVLTDSFSVDPMLGRPNLFHVIRSEF